jgi:uncharacterized protein
MTLRRLILGLAAAAALSSGCSSGGSAPAPARANDPGKFVWHDLTTNDPAACKTFYTGLLGWQYADTTIDGHAYTVARLGEKPVAGIHAPRPDRAGKTPSHWLSYMSVADVDATVGKAKAAGGVVLGEPHDVGTVGRAAVLRDPQGAPFGLVRFSAGDPVDPATPVEGTFFWNEYLTHDVETALAFYNVRPNWLPYVFVTDPAAFAAKATALGGKVLLAPRSEFRKGSLAVVADPTGAVFALQKYPY